MICVGIDIAKGKSTVCFLKPGGEVLKTPYDMEHTAEEITKLIRDIRSYDEEVRVVLEATGHYHLPVVAQLLEANVFVCVVNALRMKKFCSQDIRKAKTDKIDAAKIAAFGLTYWQELEQTKPTDEVYRELRLLSRQYFQLTSMLVKAKITMNNLLDNIMPGITDLLYDREPNHKLTDFVLRYLHFDKISAIGEKKFISGYCAWAKKQGYRMYERQAEEIFALVQNSIPALPMTASTTIVVKEAIKVVRELENSRASILAQMQTFAKSLPEYSLIREMACVGDTLTPLVIAEIGDVRNFHSKHALIAYAGIDAPPYQSGGFYGTERHISKRGNGYLRHVGFEIMQCKLRLKPEGDAVYEFIQKKRSEGKCGKEAMVAGINKFLRIYYGKVTELYRELEA